MKKMKKMKNIKNIKTSKSSRSFSNKNDHKKLYRYKVGLNTNAFSSSITIC
jgi:hypothetical protein